QNVQRHLNCIESEPAFPGDVEHIQMDVGIFVTGKPDVAYLSGLSRFDKSLHGSSFREDPIGVIEANNLVMLKQVDMVHSEAFERLVELSSCLLLCPSVNFCHHEGLLSIPIFQRLTKADLALPFVIIPGVVHEG